MTRFVIKLLCLLTLASCAFSQTLLDSTLTYQKVHRVRFDDDSTTVLVDRSTTTTTTTHFSQRPLPDELVPLRSKLEIDKLQKLMNGESKSYDITTSNPDSIKLLSWLPTMWSTTSNYRATWDKVTEQFSVQISQQHSSERLQSWPMLFLYILVCTLAFFIFPTSDKKWLKYGLRLAYYLLLLATINSIIFTSFTWWLISIAFLTLALLMIIRDKKHPLDSDDRMWSMIIGTVMLLITSGMIYEQQNVLSTQVPQVNILCIIYMVVSLVLFFALDAFGRWRNKRKTTKKQAKA